MSPSKIHPTAVIDPAAEIEDGVEVGPFCVIEAGVKIGAGTKLAPYVHIQGLTTIGKNNSFGTGSTIGHPPQHTGYQGAPTRLVIGDGNTIREAVSIHRAFKEGEATVIGDGCYLMGYSHVGHDCVLGNGVIVANTALLAGHVTVGDRAFISGFVAVHQFCRVGRLAMLSGMTGINKDVPPFMIVSGRPGFIRALNKVGLSRAGFGPALRSEIKRAFKLLYLSGKTPKAAIAELEAAEGLAPETRELVDFYNSSKRGVTGFVAYNSKEINDQSEEGEG